MKSGIFGHQFSYVVFSNVSLVLAGLNTNEEMKQLYPKEEDLVLLWLPENTGVYEHDGHDIVEHAHFGYVSRSSISNRVPGVWLLF